MKYSSRNYLIKLSFNVGILIFAILTILSGIYQVSWYLREFSYSEPYYLDWNYGIYSYPHKGILAPTVNFIFSTFFLVGIFMQLILYKDVDLYPYYIYSLGLTVLGLFGCFIIPRLGYGVEEEFYYFEEFQRSSQILPGFYWGLLSLLLIVVKKYIIKIIDVSSRSCPNCCISMERLEKDKEKLIFQCPECLKVFREPTKKIEKQDYMNLGWLRHQHYNLEKSVQEIADEQNVSMITIKKWVEKLIE
ncbi:MAG: hypothetical protein ACFFBE_16785 [Promethearchaeota archaeon]